MRDLKPRILILVAGLVLGIAGSAAGLLVSPQLHGIEREFRCVGCHGSIHGAVQIETLPYNALVLLTGDVAKAGFVTVNDVFPYRADPPRSVTLAEFVRLYGGTTEFSQLVLVSTDGGRVALDQQYVTEKSLLLPYLEGVRFSDENQHVSTWLKGINQIIVIGKERPVLVSGKPYTMGQLLAGPVVTVSTEAGRAMKANAKTEAIFRGEYAHLHTGAALGSLLGQQQFSALTVVDATGNSVRIPKEKTDAAILTIVDNRTTMVLPTESRREWVFGVTEVRVVP